ncbi:MULTISPECIES: DUF6270 domain-containing protein [unclassified Priestia]|uniref:DUF6270 domain-containing protein n=1 Tax=unclassified Priestia TaxID=2800374 RepID=UPI0036734989
MIDVLIFGSCVTRDTFSFFPEEFKVVDYFARSSLISLMSEDLPIDESDLNLSSAFQKKMILYDFQKVFLKQIQQYSFDLLIIDLIDERLDLLKYNNRYVTRSGELVNSKFEQSERYSFDLVMRKSEKTHELWEKSCVLFFSKLLEYIPPEKIILNKVFWSYKYRDGNKIYDFPDEKLQIIKNNNNILKRYYSVIESQVPKIHFIDYPLMDFIADKNHKWGLSPFHYEQRHYLKCKNKIKDIWMQNKL